MIALADEGGDVYRLAASDLGLLLGEHHSLRVVVLNSCESARASALDVFSSTASVLVRRGLPAVVAMQYEISDEAAIQFARGFYEAVAEQLPADAAVTRARRAVRLSRKNTFEWATPVLYLRSPDAQLFDLSTVAEAPAVGPTLEPPSSAAHTDQPSDEDLRIEGLSAFYTANWDKAVDCFRTLLAHSPQDHDLQVKLKEASVVSTK